MPERFQVIERIAFSLVVLSAVLCSGFIAYESSPDVQAAVKVGENVMRYTGDYSFACASPMNSPCAQLQGD